MNDIPSFEPNWNLDDPDIIGQNADAFKTIQETIARIKLIKEVGLANLHEKGVLMNEPYCSVYDMVSAIKNIPVSSGWPRQIPKFESKVIINRLSTEKRAWLSALPTILATYDNIKVNKIPCIGDASVNPATFYWERLQKDETKNLKIKIIPRDSVFVFVWYSILKDNEESYIPFSLSDGWDLLKISGNFVQGGLNYKVACYIKNKEDSYIDKVEEEVSITSNSNYTVDCCIVDFWNYKSIPSFIFEMNVVGYSDFLKDFDEPSIMIMRNSESASHEYLLEKNTVRKNFIFDYEMYKNAIILDRDNSGERRISLDEEIYSFLLFKLGSEEVEN